MGFAGDSTGFSSVVDCFRFAVCLSNSTQLFWSGSGLNSITEVTSALLGLVTPTGSTVVRFGTDGFSAWLRGKLVGGVLEKASLELAAAIGDLPCGDGGDSGFTKT
jgi:hypothetical protein